MTGFLGSLTTFSTFGVKTYNLANQGNFRAALQNLTLSVLLGLLAVWLGHSLAIWVSKSCERPGHE